MTPVFVNPFLSVAGQRERVANVGNVLKAAVTGKGVVANTGSQQINRALSAVASNPYTSAFALAVGKSPSTALNAAKAGYGALPAAGKVATVVAAPLVVSALVSNPRAVGSVASAPSSLARFGGNASGLIADPSIEKAMQVAKESPIITTAIGVGAAAVAGRGLTGTIATIANTRAVNKNTQQALPNEVPISNSKSVPLAIPSSNAAPSMVPLTPATQVVGREVSKTSGRTLAARKRARARPSSSNTFRVQIVNQNRNSYIGRRISYKR